MHEHLGRVGREADTPRGAGYPWRFFEEPNAVPVDGEGTGGGEAREPCKLRCQTDTDRERRAQTCADGEDVQLQSGRHDEGSGGRRCRGLLMGRRVLSLGTRSFNRQGGTTMSIVETDAIKRRRSSEVHRRARSDLVYRHAPGS